MKCSSPVLWFIQCLKSLWRIICGRTRRKSISTPGTNSSTTVPFSGITVDSVSNPDSQGEEPWKTWRTTSSLVTADSPGPIPRTSAAEVWRESVVKQKSLPPAPVESEEPNFFDNMEPTLRKPKIIRLRTEEENQQPNQSSRLAFNAAAPVKSELDWMEDQEGGETWESGLGDLDPREAKKAKKLAAKQQFSTASQQFSQDTRVRRQMY